jgi:NAD(P)-dependent dehydrogenase (short-subunit alcohol dehydrogenase family)
MFDFSGKVVLVTGASGALGSTVARAFRAGGARLALTDRNVMKLGQLVAGLDPEGERTFAQACDLGHAADVDHLVQSVVERCERIDVLVNVAGAFRGGKPVHETPLDDWDAMLDSNARSVFLLSRAVAQVMVRQASGTIVSVASRAALAGGAGAAPYSVAKTAVVRLTEAMAAELRKSGIRVNCILPSTIDTPANRAAMPDGDHSEWVSPEALADLIQFLSTDAARAVTGAAIPA